MVHDRPLNRTVEEHSMDNVHLRVQVACTCANENSEQRNQRLRANTLRQREAHQRATNAHRKHKQRRMHVYFIFTSVLFSSHHKSGWNYFNITF